MNAPRTDTPTLIAALRILAEDIQSGDRVANQCIREGADRLEELHGVAGNILEGCTPADAKKLREANHALIEENGNLRAAILKTIMDNLSLADGENCTLIDLKRAINFELPEEE